MKLAWRILNDGSAYDQVPLPPDLSESTCSLTPEQVQYMRDIEFWRKLEPHEIEKIKGVCKIFTIEEWFKTPPRARLITWTWSINLDPGLRVKFDMFPQMLTRFLVWTGNRAICIDGKSAFNQYPLRGDVPYWYAIKTGPGPGDWDVAQRSAMGARPTCFVADTTLRVLAHPIKSAHATYIDNLFMGGQIADLLESGMTVRQRSEQCNYVWNEDLSDIAELIKVIVEFLGTVLNMEEKTVSLAPKVLGKLAVVWQRRESWAIRDFIIIGCTLLYTALVLGRKMGRWQRVLKYLAATQGACQSTDPKRREALLSLPFELPKEDFLLPGELSFALLLEDWVATTLENKPLPVPEMSGPEEDFLLITDASKHGWSGIIVSTKSGQATVLAAQWPEDPAFQQLLGKSAHAEPLATLGSVCHFFKPGVRARVHHIGDNSGQTGEINKGYSTAASRFLAEALQRYFPGLDIRSTHEPGATLPADRPSRGLRVDPDQLAECAAKFGVEITEIRDAIY
jgi:hypothetical protein